MIEPRARLIVALDLPDRDAALLAAARLAGHVGCFKIGHELFVREGPRLVEELRSRDEKIFLDLKLHDIPNTVAGAVRSACSLGVQMLTLHASGGRKMLEAACRATEGVAHPPMLLAVTALTSLAQPDIEDLGVGVPLSAWVEKLAALAVSSGLRGVVASPREVQALRSRLGSGTRLVVPGIRPAGTPTQDQARTATPADAILAGADFLVVGRPVLQSADPPASADRIAAEIGAALAARTQADIVDRDACGSKS